MEIGWKHARWCDDGITFHRIATEVWQVGGLWYLFLPTFHGNRRKACRVGRWWYHLPQNCRGSVAGGYLEGRGKHVWLGIYGIIHVRCIIMLSRGIIQCVSSIHVRCIIMLSRGVIQGVSSSPWWVGESINKKTGPGIPEPAFIILCDFQNVQFWNLESPVWTPQTPHKV